MYIGRLTWGRELCDMTSAEANEINRRLKAFNDLLAECKVALHLAHPYTGTYRALAAAIAKAESAQTPDDGLEQRSFLD